MVFNKKLRMENILTIAAQKKPDVSRRMLFDMKPVLQSPDSVKNDAIYYTVYRNLATINGKLKYDMTVLPQKIIGKEFTKTFGHYHENASPELYEILEGNAYFLLQRYLGDSKKIEEAYIIKAEAGEKAVIPPGFGHLAINIGKDKLVLANWIGAGNYNYNLFKDFKGGCYYVLAANGAIEFKKNPNYKSVPELKKLAPKDAPALGVKNGKDFPILDLKNAPQKLDWLINPEKYKELLTIEKLYKEI